ncbi:hypothetical protein LJB81_03115 [Desulfovibrio sp. OttesenSCG-928-M14]|nr:hypothetical protein [Desulfovibrio sp. OttesenSCG-928-M14]
MNATIKVNGTHNSIILGEADGDVTLDYSGSAAATTLHIIQVAGDVKITGVSNAVNNTTITTMAGGEVQFNGANNDFIEIINADDTFSITPGNGHDTLQLQNLSPDLDATINLHGVDNPVHNFDWIELGAATDSDGTYNITVWGFSEKASFKTDTAWGAPVEATNMSGSWLVKFTDITNNNTLTIDLADYNSGNNPVSQFGDTVTANYRSIASLNSTVIYLDKRVGLVEVQGSSGAGEESIYCSGSGNPGLDGKQDVLNLLSGFNLGNNDTIRLYDFDNGTNNGTWDKIYYDSNDWDAGPQYINDTTYTLTQGSNTLTFVLNGVTGDQTQTTNIFVDTSI